MTSNSTGAPAMPAVVVHEGSTDLVDRPEVVSMSEAGSLFPPREQRG